MNYKYQKNQIFRKRLKVPKHILTKIYNCYLSFSEFLEYDLENKIPISCLYVDDREIVEKFGIQKCKELDWELIHKKLYYINLKDVLMTIDSQVEDINTSFYELVKNQVRPSDYSLKMKERYSDRFFDISNNDSDDLKNLMIGFNNGKVNLKDIINHWELFKDKDLSFCLDNDKNNINHITSSNVKKFMSNYGKLVNLIVRNNDIYTFISTISSFHSEEEKNECIKKVTDEVLRSNIKVTDDEYREIFQYSSLEDYLKTIDSYSTSFLIKELQTLPKDYVFNTSIPFSELLNYGVLHFVSIYGLKNVVDFNEECGNFFTKDNFKMLKLMFPMYLHYAGDEYDKKKNIYCDKDGNDIRDKFTKDQFYDAMKKMIVYGPSDYNFADKAPDYRNLNGKFRVKNPELFISEAAPLELQSLFYTKSLTPRILFEHPEYVEYLKDRDFSSCFKEISIYVEGSKSLYGIENFYRFLSSKNNSLDVLNFFREYSEILEIIFDRERVNQLGFKLKFSMDDDIIRVENVINDFLKQIIVKERIPYPKLIPRSFKEKYPNLFLSKDAPKELQDAFYNRTITSTFIVSNPIYLEYLKHVDLEVLFQYMPIHIASSSSIDFDHENGRKTAYLNNFVHVVKKLFMDESLDVMLYYGRYIDRIFEANQLKKFIFYPNFSKEDFLNALDQTILQSILDGEIKYDENMPTRFKEKYPTLFLNPQVSQEIKLKFYNREFTLRDFYENPDLLKLFDCTNIACAFSENMAFIIALFDGTANLKDANNKRLKVMSAYSKIEDSKLQKEFKEYIMSFDENIELEKIEDVTEVLLALSLSNSSELFTFRKELASQILKTENPLEILNKVEDVFVKNSIPTIGKIISCFQILHPDFQGFHFGSSKISPVLQNASTTSRKMIVFSDLIKASFGSNNRSVNAYLKNIFLGSSLYEDIRNQKIQYDSLDEIHKNELMAFSKHLITLYNNTMKAKMRNEIFVSTGNVLNDIFEISKRLSSNETLDYNLGDRVIRMFCGFTGINTLKEAKEYIDQKITFADFRNRKASNTDLLLEQGDFFKGIGDITYFRNILQNGCISKEYLGSDMGSDSTPLDTDISMIISSDGTIREKMDYTAAATYGPIWIVLKNDERFITTRTHSETFDMKRDMSKLEVFYTGVLGNDHYGIRTGFASSDINYIVMENYDPRVGLEIAMNGFYIPIANKDGKIIFTSKDYDNFRQKMCGLSYYDENNYAFSENLITEETDFYVKELEQNNYEVQIKKTKVVDILKKSLDELGLFLKTTIDGDLTDGFVELIDTGSTGRGTNLTGDADFDFMMRLDKSIISNSSKLNEFKQILLKNLGKDSNIVITAGGDFRLKNVLIDLDVSVDIDITFTEKTDKLTYSTDMALQDRLNTIKRIDPFQYKYVVANIMLAKKVLKNAFVYKSKRSDVLQGGLGGVGIENWILQNGGSFIDAAKSFVEAAEGKSFTEFQAIYQIWDFGDNHLSLRKGNYSHDNFVACNMSEMGYQKMVTVLKEYLKEMEVIKDGIKR